MYSMHFRQDQRNPQALWQGDVDHIRDLPVQHTTYLELLITYSFIPVHP